MLLLPAVQKICYFIMNNGSPTIIDIFVSAFETILVDVLKPA